MQGGQHPAMYILHVIKHSALLQHGKAVSYGKVHSYIRFLFNLIQELKEGSRLLFRVQRITE